jgi:hypothetical protein
VAAWRAPVHREQPWLFAASAEADEVYELREITKMDTRAYQHQANVCCDWAVATLKTLLRASLAGGASHE